MSTFHLLATVLVFVLVSSTFGLQPPPGYPDSADSGYPQDITDKWVGANLDQPDAVFQRISNGKIYFFKGTQYWRLTDKYLLGYPANNVSDTVDAGYPQNILEKWGIPGVIVAIFQRADGKIYAFTGSVYYRITDKYLNDNVTDKSLPDVPDAGYPQNIADKWLGVPVPFQAAFYRENHLIYFFAGGQYYRIRDKYFFNLPADAVENGYPQNVVDKWIGLLPGSTAVFQRTTSGRKIYFFLGSNYYRFTDKYLLQSFPDLPDDGYPQNIQSKWLGGTTPIPAVVNGAFQRVGNGKIYIFAGSLYWRVTDKYLTDASNDNVDAGYPKQISTNWVGVPNNIDTVFQRSNGYIYFFKGNQYYRVFDKYADPSADTSAPDEVQPGYPQNITEKFVGVPNNVDVAFYRVTDKIYFTKGNLVYRLSDKYTLGYWPAEDQVDAGYPVPLSSEFGGLTTPLNGLFQRFVSNRQIYAFGNGNYWRFTDQNLAIPSFEAPPSFTAPTPAPTSAPTPTPTPTWAPTPAPTHAPTPYPTHAPAHAPAAQNQININFANLFEGYRR